MREPRKLSALERTFLTCMQTMSELSQGYTVSFLEELLRHHGISGFFRWAQGTNRVWGELVARYGERVAHLLASFGSFWNGCYYCAKGHLLAHNLHVFLEQGELFPLDEREVADLMAQRDPALLQLLRQRLAGPGNERELRLLERMLALAAGAPGEASQEDSYLLKALALYEWINECSIVTEGEPPPLGAIARQKPLRERYERARSRQRLATGS